MSVLVRLYPPAWRARYGLEFEALLAERPPSMRDRVDIVVGALDARLSPQVGAPGAARRAPLPDRLSGAAAIAGGLTWCMSYLVAGLSRGTLDMSLPIVVALGLMLLSLPGSYVARYARPVAIGGLALAGSVAVLLAQVLPWGPILLLPVVAILAVLGPGALALAAARALIPARDRWLLLFLTMPWPIIGGGAASVGFLPEGVAVPLAITCVLPMGIAWIATGARLARGTARGPGVPPAPTTSITAAAGGPA